MGERLLDGFVDDYVDDLLDRTSLDVSGVADASAQLRAEVAAAEAELAAFVESVSAADIGAEAFGAGARSRRARVDAAHKTLRSCAAASAPLVGSSFLDAQSGYMALDVTARNCVLRGLLEGVTVERAGGRGSRRPLAERVTITPSTGGLRALEAGLRAEFPGHEFAADRWG